jgi:hypothetical protein
MTRQELEDLYDSAVADIHVFRMVTRDPDLWRTLTEVAHDRERASWGKWYRVLAVFKPR